MDLMSPMFVAVVVGPITGLLTIVGFVVTGLWNDRQDRILMTRIRRAGKDASSEVEQ